MDKKKMDKRNSKMTVIPLKDQPLSSYRWIAYRKGYNNLHEVAEHFNVSYTALKKSVSQLPESEKVITGIIKKLCKYDMTYKGNFIVWEKNTKMFPNYAQHIIFQKPH